MKKWIWPVSRFWTFTPHGWLLAILWNFFEFLNLRMPKAHLAFALIIGRKPNKK